MNISEILNQKEFLALQDCKARIIQWMEDYSIDQESKNEIISLIEKKDISQLRDCFYQELEFGTGGLRGIIGAGSNRMNSYVLRRAIQGLANYICKQSPDVRSMGVAIAHDCRRFSDVFARDAARVLAANGIKVYLFPQLETTPVLSYAIRYLKCISGVCVTASHNPPQYNGAKVYWSDGAQIVPPTDEGILKEVFAVKSFSDTKIISLEEGLEKGLIEWIDDKVVQSYYKSIDSLKIQKETKDNIKIIFTPLHGTGSLHAQKLLNRWGYYQFKIVPEQEKPNGEFPTVAKPNPEEPAALKMAVNLAEKEGADVVFAADPDSDRFALVVKDSEAAQGFLKHQALSQNYCLLNGNQTGALFIYYILKNRKIQGSLHKNHKIVKTIVTSRLHEKICEKFDVECFDTLTGFKWIAALVRSWEESQNGYEYLFGTEESFGYMPGSYVRDKDGMAMLCMAAEMASLFKSEGKTVVEGLFEIFSQYGSWQEGLVNVDLVGEEGAKRIGRMMEVMRQNLSKGEAIEFAGSKVVTMRDYKTLKEWNWDFDSHKSVYKDILNIPSSNVLQIDLCDGSRVSMRPSGTEPKIKFYSSAVISTGVPQEDYQVAVERIKGIEKSVWDFVNSVE